MVNSSAFFALVVFLALYGSVIPEGIIPAIPTSAFKFESPTPWAVDQLRPLEYFHFLVLGFHTLLL